MVFSKKIPLNSEQQNRILKLEVQLYKANDRINVLKKKCEEKNARISRLESQVQQLKKQHQKEDFNSALLAVCSFKINIYGFSIKKCLK